MPVSKKREKKQSTKVPRNVGKVSTENPRWLLPTALTLLVLRRDSAGASRKIDMSAPPRERYSADPPRRAAAPRHPNQPMSPASSAFYGSVAG